MPFEFDPDKSTSNKHKQGLDFVEAQQLWDDENRYEISKEYRSEKRYAVVGRIGSQIYAAICTNRGERIRIVSVRKALEDEKRLSWQSIDECG